MKKRGTIPAIVAMAAMLSACGGASAPASSAAPAAPSIAAVQSPAASAKPLGGIAGSPQASGAATAGDSGAGTAPKAAGDLSACPPRQPSLNLGGVLTEAYSPHPAEGRFSTTLYVRLMHTPLFGVDPLEENLNVNYGAVEWKYLPGATGLALTVRPNLTFNNGDPVDANAVKFSIEAASSEFADAQLSGTLKEVGIKDIKVQDAQHLEVDFKGADATFVLEFSPLVDPIYLLDPKAHSNGTISRQAFDDYKKKPVGSGPYDYSSGQAQQFITMKAARQDPVLGCPLYDTVTFRNIKETGTRMAELKTGQLDVAQTDRDQLDGLKSANLSVLTKPGQNIIGLYFFMTYLPNNITADQNFRAAVTYSIDWQSIASSIFKGVGVSPWGCTWPPSFEISQQDPRYQQACGTPYPYDPQKAKDFLAKSNYKGTPLDLLMWGNYPEEAQVAQAMQPMMKAVGINAQIKQVTRTEEDTLRQHEQEPNSVLFFGPGERVTSLSGSVSVWGPDQHWGPRQDKDVQDALKKEANAASLQDYVNATVTLGQLIHDRFYGPGFFDAASIWAASSKVPDWGLSKSRGRTPLNLSALTTQAGKDERTAQGLK